MKPIDAIKPYERNPRINDAAVQAVANSIKSYGFRQPIVVDKDHTVVVGHTRLKAAVALGMTKVPVHVATELTDEQCRAYRLADNRTNQIAEWDLDILPLELAELQDLGVDLTLLGFQDDEITRLLNAGSNVGECDPDAVPEPPDEPVTKPGDLILLGKHRLLCGDSAKTEDVDRLLDGAAVHLVNTDPPYNVKVEPRSNNAIAAGLSSFQTVTTGTGKRVDADQQRADVKRHPEKAKPTTRKMRAKDRPLANDFLSDEEFSRILDAWFKQISRVLLPGRAFYVWGGYSNLSNFPPALAANELYFSQAIVWDKQHPVLSRKDYMGAFEICFYGWRSGAAHQFYGPNNIPDLWSIKKVAPQAMCHLTQKPVELAARAMLYSSKPGENVLDLFGGSGSTLIAAEQQGRRAFVMELDSLYADVVVDRWQRYTGQAAVYAKTGKKFPKAPPATREVMR